MCRECPNNGFHQFLPQSYPCSNTISASQLDFDIVYDNGQKPLFGGDFSFWDWVFWIHFYYTKSCNPPIPISTFRTSGECLFSAPFPFFSVICACTFPLCAGGPPRTLLLIFISVSTCWAVCSFTGIPGSSVWLPWIQTFLFLSLSSEIRGKDTVGNDLGF